jgi:D-proline reductase (dithiol) PrdA
MEQIGKRGIPVVGMTYAAVQGQLVVGNAYMDALVDLNKSPQGLENEVLAYNTLCPEDAIRALAMLKAKMAGEIIQPAPQTWDPAIKARNIQRIEDATGRKVALSASEPSLPTRSAIGAPQNTTPIPLAQPS